MISLQERVYVKVSYQDSLMTAVRNDSLKEKVFVNVSYQDSLMTAGKNDYFLRKGV
jgi:hypothetical protein